MGPAQRYGQHLITDAIVRADIAQEWAVIEGMKTWSRSSATIGGFINETPPTEFYNLPLVLAYATLDEFLLQCIAEHVFTMPPPPPKPTLASRMDASVGHISWVDFSLAVQGRKARNGLAHEAVLVPKVDCLRYINAIGNELRSWGVIS